MRKGGDEAGWRGADASGDDARLVQPEQNSELSGGGGRRSSYAGHEPCKHKLVFPTTCVHEQEMSSLAVRPRTERVGRR